MRIYVLGVLLSLVACNTSEGFYSSEGTKDSATAIDQRIDTSSVVADMGVSVDQLIPDTSCTPVITECGSRCGLVRDPCTGKEFQCGDCTSGKVCEIETHQCVIPRLTCSELNAECGRIKNSCGERLDCGKCPMGQECDPDTNQCVSCQNVSCADLGYECGQAWLGCGPITNKTDCGTCSSGVCNEAFHICEPNCVPGTAIDICAKAKAAKGVECGYISDGCGGLVDCGGCPAGEQCGVYGIANRCDPIETRDECTALGYECGTISSICGGTVKCGDCPNGLVCNSNHKCGPACQPKTCSDVLVNGKECGTFSDGCNGTITCGCSTSGAVCTSQNTCCVNTEVCGPLDCNKTVTDQCTGQTKTCGCQDGMFCNTATSTCESGKSCSDYKAGGTYKNCNDYQFYDRGDGAKFSCRCQYPATCINDSPTQEGECCTNMSQCTPGKCDYSVTDDCTGAKTQCGCIGSQFCNNGFCENLYTCSKYNANGYKGSPCSNGKSTSFPAGDGTYLACPCVDGSSCINNGHLVSGNEVGICVEMNQCSDYGATGYANATCSNGPSPSFPKGDGTNLSCPCQYGYECMDNGHVVTGSQLGVCVKMNTCTDYKATGYANAPCSNGPSPTFPKGDGSDLSCPCQYGYTCMNNGQEVYGSEVGVCTKDKTCFDYGATGYANATCSNGPSPIFPRGDGTDLTCPCYGGYVCADNGTVVSGTEDGTCQAKKTCADYNANGNSGNICSNSYSSAFPDGFGTNLKCGCSSGLYCVNGSSVVSGDTTGTCTAGKTCADYGANGNVGDTCNDYSFFDNGMGSTFACRCNTSGGKTNNSCQGDSYNSAGKCECIKRSCTCDISGQSDGCGGTLSCPCAGGSVCNASTKQCCPQYSCSSLPPGIPVNACGSIPDSCSGKTISCGCVNANEKCVTLSGKTYGTCECVPKTCQGLGVGTWPDGCGGTITCSG